MVVLDLCTRGLRDFGKNRVNEDRGNNLRQPPALLADPARDPAYLQVQ